MSEFTIKCDGLEGKIADKTYEYMAERGMHVLFAWFEDGTALLDAQEDVAQIALDFIRARYPDAIIKEVHSEQ